MNDKTTQKKKSKGGNQQGKKQKNKQKGQNQPSNNNNKSSKKNKKNKKQNNQRRPPEITDIIKSITDDLKRKDPPSSWAILEKYNQSEFDYSVINLGQQMNAGYIHSMTDAYVRLLQSLDICFRLAKNPNSQMEFLKVIQSIIKTTKNILYEFIQENEVFNNIFVYFQTLATKLTRTTNSIFEMKKKLRGHVREYITEKFINSDTLLLKYAERFVRDGESLMIFSPNTIILHFLFHMRSTGINFTVYLIEDGNSERNQRVAEILNDKGIKVVYGLFSSASYHIKSVDKILLGGDCIYSNGYLQTSCGASSIGLLASQQRIPLYVLVKTYKFSDKIEMNHFNLNSCKNFKGIPGKQDEDSHYQVDLKFDLLPCRLISLLITEMGLMPPTGVPVILKELRKDEFL